MVDAFDIVVVGGGPAGGHCARILAGQGRRVLLSERVTDFANHDFSSGAVPIETLTRFALPESLIGARFQSLEVISSGAQHVWKQASDLGAVLDFAELRRFLAAETMRQGGTVRMGSRYLGHTVRADGRVDVRFDEAGRTLTVETGLIVDATGPARAVMRTVRPTPARPYFTVTGLEHLIEVSPQQFARYADRLLFFVGRRWAPQGYGWIFPMAGNRLRVGSVVYQPPTATPVKPPSLKAGVAGLLREHLGLDPAQVRIIHTHGGALRMSEGLHDDYSHAGVVAIGDAVSCVNPLGCEGIRHGMECAEIAARHIAATAVGQPQARAFTAYRREMRRRYRITWMISFRLARAGYLERSDASLDASLRRAAKLDVDQVMALFFQYSFTKVGWAALRRWLRNRWQRIWG